MTAPSPAGLSPLLDQLDEALRNRGTSLYGDEVYAATVPAALPQLTAAIRAVEALHTPVEWFEEVEPGDEVFDPTKPLPPFCHECTDNEYVNDVEMGYRIDQGSPVVHYPCATVQALTAALTPGADTAGATA